MHNIPETIKQLGIKRIAKKLAVPYTTVHYWTLEGKVPQWREAAVMQAIRAVEFEDAPDSPPAQSPRRTITKDVGEAAS